MLIIASVVIIKHVLDIHSPITQLFAFLALALLAAALVTHAAGDPSWMSIPFLRLLGKYSYAIYLWHSLVIGVVAGALFRTSTPLLGKSHLRYYLIVIPAVVVATIGIALVSWYAIERPFLKLKRLAQYQ